MKRDSEFEGGIFGPVKEGDEIRSRNNDGRDGIVGDKGENREWAGYIQQMKEI